MIEEDPDVPPAPGVRPSEEWMLTARSPDKHRLWSVGPFGDKADATLVGRSMLSHSWSEVSVVPMVPRSLLGPLLAEIGGAGALERLIDRILTGGKDS